MKKRIIFLTTLVTISAFAFVSCQREKSSGVGTVEGYAPIYASSSEIFTISSKQAQAYITPGKIVQQGTTTYQVDNGTGIHIIDATDVKNPTKVRFISIPGVSEITLQNNVLLCNNFNDLVSIDLSDINNVKVLSRVQNVFTNNLYAPTAQNAYFECVDETKGNVIGWKKTTLTDPRCKTSF